jgi:hypothetical protein
MRRLIAALGLVCGLLGFSLGRWSCRSAPMLTEGSVTPLPERDLSPKGEARTVVMAAVKPGRPAPPPTPVPEDAGTQLSTTSTTLPALPEGGVFHASTFAHMEGAHLQLRTVEWLDTAHGRVSLGPAETIEAPLPLQVRGAPELYWSASILIIPHVDRLTYGASVQYARGPMVASLIYAEGRGMIGVGARW